MKGGGRRPEQVAETVRQVVADALLTQLRDPRLGSSAVTGARVTRDLSHATIYIAARGDEEARASALEAFRGAGGFLRARLGKALSTRVVPELRFELDRSEEQGRKIDAILADLHREEPAG